MDAKANEFSEPVVSSAHLAAGAMPALSEFEFSAIMLSHAFDGWIVRCMAAAGVSDMSPVDVMVLHTVRHLSALPGRGYPSGTPLFPPRVLAT